MAVAYLLATLRAALGTLSPSARNDIMTQTIKAPFQNMPSLDSNGQPMLGLSGPAFASSDSMQGILPEDVFLGILCLERKRAERSNKKFLLLLLDAEDAPSVERQTEIIAGITQASDAVRRGTDPAGW